MAALKVYGNPMSAATMRVLACLYEKDLGFHLVRVVNSPTGVEKNLFGEVTALEDGSFMIYGSRAITNYIACAKTGKQPLIPSDEAKKGAMFELMDIEARKFDPLASKIVYEMRLKQILEMASATELDAVDQHKKQRLEKVLDLYEERIKDMNYCADKGEENRITLADVNHMPLFHYLCNTPSLKDLVHSRLAVNEWCKFILDRPAWGKVIAATTDRQPPSDFYNLC